MFCNNCGSQLPDNATFCTSCGASVSNPNAASGPQPIYSQPKQAQNPQPQTPPQPQYAQPQYAQPQYAQPQYAQPQQPAYPPQPTYPNNGYVPPAAPYGQPAYDDETAPRSVGFGQAVKLFFHKYATFKGRASRSEFWWSYLFTFLLSLTIIGAFVCLVPMLAVSIRRLHDTGKSGWYYLLSLIPYVGGIIMIVLYCQDSTGDNQYGPGKQPAYTPSYGTPYQPR